MEKIGTVIRNHRLSKNMTQEELGKKVFVSKQAISKWETGKTMPDIEMIRKLCDILEISKDEILGKSINETKNTRKKLKISLVISSLSFIIIIIFGLDVIDVLDYIERNTQSSVAYITVYSNEELLTTNEYKIKCKQKTEDLKNAYKLKADYGEIRGIVQLNNQKEIEYGFININNWHNIQIRLDINQQENQVCVRQTVSYMTENNLFEIIETNEISDNKYISVFKEGI